MKNIKNYKFKVLENGKEVDSLRTHSVRLFITRLRTIKFLERTSVYLRVSYGKKLDIYGEYSNFYNDGFYDNRKDLLEAFKAFNDEE